MIGEPRSEGHRQELVRHQYASIRHHAGSYLAPREVRFIPFTSTGTTSHAIHRRSPFSSSSCSSVHRQYGLACQWYNCTACDHWAPSTFPTTNRSGPVRPCLSFPQLVFPKAILLTLHCIMGGVMARIGAMIYVSRTGP